MEDISETSLEFRNRMEKEIRSNHLLGGHDLMLNDHEDSIPWIMDHIDYFTSQSRGNKRGVALYLLPQLLIGHDDEMWDKVGQAVGNLLR